MIPLSIALYLILSLASVTEGEILRPAYWKAFCINERDYAPYTTFKPDCDVLFRKLGDVEHHKLYDLLQALTIRMRGHDGISEKPYLNLDMKYGQCWLYVNVIPEASTSDIPSAFWETLWPSFQDQMAYIMARCVEKNIAGNAVLQYEPPFFVDRVKLSISNRYSKSYDDFKNDESESSNLLSSPPPPSSDPSFSPPVAQAMRDHAAINILDLDQASNPGETPRLAVNEASAQTVRRGVCSWCPSCWERNDKFWLRVWPAITVGTTLVGTLGGAALGAKLNAIWASHPDSGTALAQEACSTALDSCTSENYAMLASLAAWRQANPMCPGPNL